MNIENSCVNTNLMLLFLAKALDLFSCLKPRAKARGNSNQE
jgi:hypothetical protein